MEEQTNVTENMFFKEVNLSNLSKKVKLGKITSDYHEPHIFSDFIKDTPAEDITSLTGVE